MKQQILRLDEDEFRMLMELEAEVNGYIEKNLSGIAIYIEPSKHLNRIDRRLFEYIDNLDNCVDIKSKFSICTIRKQCDLINRIVHNLEEDTGDVLEEKIGGVFN